MIIFSRYLGMFVSFKTFRCTFLKQYPTLDQDQEHLYRSLRKQPILVKMMDAPANMP